MDKNPFREGNLNGPLVIVAIGPSEVLLVQKGKEGDPMAEAQMYEMDRGENGGLLEEIKPLGVWLKYLFGVDVVKPVIPWTEQERLYRQEVYKAAQKARESANG